MPPRDLRGIVGLALLGASAVGTALRRRHAGPRPNPVHDSGDPRAHQTPSVLIDGLPRFDDVERALHAAGVRFTPHRDAPWQHGSMRNAGPTGVDHFVIHDDRPLPAFPGWAAFMQGDGQVLRPYLVGLPVRRRGDPRRGVVIEEADGRVRVHFEGAPPRGGNRDAWVPHWHLSLDTEPPAATIVTEAVRRSRQEAMADRVAQVRAAVQAAGGRIAEAAQAIGISRQGLYLFLQAHPEADPRRENPGRKKAGGLDRPPIRGLSPDAPGFLRDVAGRVPPGALELAEHLWDEVHGDTLICGNSGVASGWWVETHTLGCRDAGGDLEAGWEDRHQQILDEYRDDGVSIVTVHEDSGIFITFTPQRKRRNPGAVYVPVAPTVAQERCPHRIRNREDAECTVCGSIKRGNRWWYLRKDWFDWYTSGKGRPSGS